MRTVLVLMDSLNRRHLSAYNPEAGTITPNIDRFAQESVLFDNHFIGSAPCMPARRDLFTGRTAFLERGWGGIEPFDRTLPACLRKNGVYTHLDTDHTHYFELGGEGYAYQFHTWDYHRGQEFDAWISQVNPPETDPRSYGKKSAQYLLNRTEFHTDADYPSPKTFRAACKWAERNRGADNFFLMVESFDPHEPFDCPQEYHDLYPEEPYDGPEFNWSTYAPVTEPPDAVRRLNDCYKATLTMNDRWFGRFLDSLKENGLYEDTLIILTTDHGHMLGEHGFTGKNFMHAYNELAHIPLMIRLPDGSRAGQRVDALTQNIDLMPTILNHHGCEIPETVLGMDLLPLMDGTGTPREAVLYGWFGRAVNVCDGRYTYFRAPQSPENRPLYLYCGVPATIWRYYGPEYADHMTMGRFLPYTNYPVYRIEPLGDHDISGPISFVQNSELYDIKEDYCQQRPISDSALEAEMCGKLARCMEQAQSPKEQFLRLGLALNGQNP